MSHKTVVLHVTPLSLADTGILAKITHFAAMVLFSVKKNNQRHKEEGTAAVFPDFCVKWAYESTIGESFPKGPCLQLHNHIMLMWLTMFQIS